MDEKDNDRCDQADQRRACEQAQSCQLAIDGLAAQFQAERLLRKPLLLFHLLALELEPRVIAIERLLERRDDDIGQPRFDLTGNSLRRRRSATATFPAAAAGGVLEPARGVAKCDDRIVGAEESSRNSPDTCVQNVFPAGELSHASRNRRCASVNTRPACSTGTTSTVDRRSSESSTSAVVRGRDADTSPRAAAGARRANRSLNLLRAS